eukprot:6200689-Pleurochrysis_carterae.AAC.4
MTPRKLPLAFYDFGSAIQGRSHHRHWTNSGPEKAPMASQARPGTALVYHPALHMFQNYPLPRHRHWHGRSAQPASEAWK